MGCVLLLFIYCYYRQNRQCVKFENGSTFHDEPEGSCVQRVAYSYILLYSGEIYTCSCSYTACFICTCSLSTILTLKTGPCVFDNNSKFGILLSLRRKYAYRKKLQVAAAERLPSVTQGQIHLYAVYAAAAALSFCPFIFDPRLIRI